MRNVRILSSRAIISMLDFFFKGLLKIFRRHRVCRDRSICRGHENVGRRDYSTSSLNIAVLRFYAHKRTIFFRIHALEPTSTTRLEFTYSRLCLYVCSKIYTNVELTVFSSLSISKLSIFSGHFSLSFSVNIFYCFVTVFILTDLLQRILLRA